MFKEPIALGSRRLVAPSSPSRRNVFGPSIKSQNIQTVRASHTHSVADGIHSNLPSTMNALSLTESDDDSDIEVIGPFPVLSNPKTGGKGVRAISVGVGRNAIDKPLHPFFVPAASSKPLASKSSASTTTKPAPVKAKGKAIPTPKSKVPPTFNTVPPPTSDTTLEALTKGNDPILAEAIGRQGPLPKYSYRDYHPTPTVVYTRHEGEADDLISGLKPGPISLDLEWCFYFTKRSGITTLNERRVAVVQVADTRGMVLVIQIFGMGRFPKGLQALIENPDIPKMGVNILNDGKKLFRDYGILAQNLVELGALALVADPAARGQQRVVSLAKLVEQYCGKLLEKGSVRTGNWEAQLDQQQIDYAVNDAHSTIQVYNELAKIADQMSISLWNDNNHIYTQAVEWHRSTSLEARANLTMLSKTPVRPQHLRAYQYWHFQNMSMEKMCIALSLKDKGYGLQIPGEDKNLKPSTVISYILGALQSDSTLQFQIDNVKELLQMEITSWSRHHNWILEVWEKRKL